MGQGFTLQGPNTELWKIVFQQQEQHLASWLAPHTVVLTDLELPFTVSYGHAANAMCPPLVLLHVIFLLGLTFSSNEAARIQPYGLMGPYPLYALQQTRPNIHTETAF